MLKFSKDKLKRIAIIYNLEDIYLFGSRIVGFSRQDSDFDIGVRFQNGLPKIEERGRIYGKLFADLSQIFPERKIDLVFIEEVPLHFQFKILTEGRLIYTKDRENSLNFLEKIVNLYRDYEYFINEYFEGVLARKI